MSDYISRMAASDHLKNRLYQTAYNNIGTIMPADEVYLDMAEHRVDTWLNEVPSIDPKRQNGKWIPTAPIDDDGNVRHKCSVCHHSDTHAKGVIVPYCWFCGSKMDTNKKTCATCKYKDREPRECPMDENYECWRPMEVDG